MKDEFNYKSVPFNFAHCFQSQCLKAAHCLRNIAAQHVTNDSPFISIVNPACIPTDAEACSFFQSSQKIQVAWGIAHLLDHVPHKEATGLKSLLIGHFGRSKYYRLYRKENPLTPEDQAYIQRLFRQRGIQEALSFDSYSKEYNW